MVMRPLPPQCKQGWIPSHGLEPDPLSNTPVPRQVGHDSPSSSLDKAYPEYDFSFIIGFALAFWLKSHFKMFISVFIK
jgi:hypothetical protein